MKSSLHPSPKSKIIKTKHSYYGRKKNDLPLSGAYVGRGLGTEVCEGSIRYELGGADGTERERIRGGLAQVCNEQ